MAGHVCPWWIGYFLISPARRLFQNPEKILRPYIRPRMTILDVGCGMGFFSLDMARMAGPQGKVICVDLQEQMISALSRRASKAGLLGRMDCRICSKENLGIEDCNGQIDFALAFAIVHEIPGMDSFLHQLYSALKPDGICLIAEPRGHVSNKAFNKTETAAQKAGLTLIGRPDIWRSRAVVLKR